MANTGDIKAGRAYVELYADRAKLSGNLDEARAQVNRWSAEMARAQSNAAKAAAAGDTGSAARQRQRAVAAGERLATAQQESAGRAALAQRLAGYKAVRSSAQAAAAALPINQLAAAVNQQKSMGKVAAGNVSHFEQMGTAAIKIGVAIAAVKSAITVVGMGSAAWRGDWEKVNELAFRLPLGLGEIARTAAEVTDELTGVAKAIEEITRRGNEQKKYASGIEFLGNTARDSSWRASQARRSDEGARLADLIKQRDEKLKQIAKSDGSSRARAAAVKAVNAEFESQKARPLAESLRGLEAQAATAGMTAKEKSLWDLKNLGAGAAEMERAARALGKIESADVAGNVKAIIEAAKLRATTAGKSPIEAAIAAIRDINPEQVKAVTAALEVAQKAEARVAADSQVAGYMRRIALATGKMTEVDAAVADFQKANPGSTEAQLKKVRAMAERANLADFAKGEADKLPKADELATYGKRLQGSLKGELMTQVTANAAWAGAIGQRMTTRGTTGGSAAAIQSLQSGPAFDALTKASQETAKNTRKLVEGGLAQFG